MILPVAAGHGEGDRREAMVEGRCVYVAGPSTTPCGRGPPPHRFATGRIKCYAASGRQ
jgi:hypothetical protein